MCVDVYSFVNVLYLIWIGGDETNTHACLWFSGVVDVVVVFVVAIYLYIYLNTRRRAFEGFWLQNIDKAFVDYVRGVGWLGVWMCVIISYSPAILSVPYIVQPFKRTDSVSRWSNTKRETSVETETPGGSDQVWFKGHQNELDSWPSQPKIPYKQSCLYQKVRRVTLLRGARTWSLTKMWLQK